MSDFFDAHFTENIPQKKISECFSQNLLRNVLLLHSLSIIGS